MAKILKYLSEENLFAFANDVISVKPDEIEEVNNNFLSIGKLYSLQNEQYDGFETRKNVYELIAILYNVNQVEVNSLVMKPVDVETSMIFSLTRQDCNNLGIRFQEGLQLFPIEMNWSRVDCVDNENNNNYLKEFNDNDLSTYPVDKESKTVMRMVIRLTGFTQISLDMIRTPYHTLIRLNELIQSLEIHYRETSEPFPNAHKKSLSGRIITNFIANESITNGYIVDNSSNSIFIELDLTYKDMSNDKVYGLKPDFFSNKNINDVFIVSWIENSNNRNIANTLTTQSPKRLYIKDKPLYSIEEFNNFYKNDFSKTSRNIRWI